MNQHFDPGHEMPEEDIAPHVEAARVGFNATAKDIMETMYAAGVPNAGAAVLSGMVQAAVETWCATMIGVGNPPLRVREELLQQVKTYARKNLKQ